VVRGACRCMGEEMGSVYKFWLESLKGRDMDGRIILEWFLEK